MLLAQKEFDSPVSGRSSQLSAPCLVYSLGYTDIGAASSCYLGLWVQPGLYTRCTWSSFIFAFCIYWLSFDSSLILYVKSGITCFEIILQQLHYSTSLKSPENLWKFFYRKAGFMTISIYNGKKGVSYNLQFMCVILLPLNSVSMEAKYSD